MSDPQTPTEATRIRTSCGPGSGSGRSSTARSPAARRTLTLTAPSLDGSEGQAPDELVLGGEAGDENRQRHQGRGCAELAQEQALAGDETDQEDRRGGGADGGEVDREHELVPAEDEADQAGCGQPGGCDGGDDAPQGTEQAGTVNLGGLEDLPGDLGQERAHHPPRDGRFIEVYRITKVQMLSSMPAFLTIR